MSRKKTPGVYSIIHIESGRIYIGSAASIESRWNWHRNHLRDNRHPNEYLQRAWNKHGESAFKFQVIEIVENKSELIATEQKYMDFFRVCERDHGFNIAPRAGTSRGTKMNDAFRARMSVIHTGRKRPQGTKDAISAALMGNKNGAGHSYCGYLTESDVVQILNRVADVIPYKIISSEFDVHERTIFRIAKRHTWARVQIAPELQERLSQSFLVRRNRNGGRNTKLTKQDVETIKSQLTDSKRGIYASLARQFHVSPATIYLIKHGVTWQRP